MYVCMHACMDGWMDVTVITTIIIEYYCVYICICICVPGASKRLPFFRCAQQSTTTRRNTPKSEERLKTYVERLET